MIDLNETTFESFADLQEYLRSIMVKEMDAPGKVVKGMYKGSCILAISFTDGTYAAVEAGDYCLDDRIALSELVVLEIAGVFPRGFVKKHRDLWSQNSQKQYESSLYDQYKTLAKKFGPLPPEELEKL